MGRTSRRIGFERRLRWTLYAAGVPLVALTVILLHQQNADSILIWISAALIAGGWSFLVSSLMGEITRPLQTLANVVAALREDDFSFRARGGRRNDAIGDLALEINRLAGLLQAQRSSALEAMELAERVMLAMQSPVLAFDPDCRLRLVNAAASDAFGLKASDALGTDVRKLSLARLVDAGDGEVLSLGSGQHTSRWVVRRAGFRLRGVPHQLLVLSDVSAALREEERQAWERLIRVLGHEINNSLTPIKSIAGSLRARIGTLIGDETSCSDFDRGLQVIENRSDSLNRFLQAYRQLMRLPAPRLRRVALQDLMERVAQVERRVSAVVHHGADLALDVDPDQMEQALINLVRNAADAALSPDVSPDTIPSVEIAWRRSDSDLIVSVSDNGPGLSNEANLFVPFYTTKPGGTGIGLVLAQQIAQAHQGSVRLANRTDGTPGCVAELRLPAASISLIDVDK